MEFNEQINLIRSDLQYLKERLVGIPHYTVREVTTATYTYNGFAEPGMATTAAKWLIIRETIADSTLLFADGNKNFDNVWDDHLTLSYS